MRAVVVDASVVTKWFIAEEQSDIALRLLASPAELLAPNLIWSEVGNILWKRVRRQQISLDESQAIFNDLLRMPLETTPVESLLAEAFGIAVETDRSVYDSL